MERPQKEVRIQMLEARLQQYEQQHESLEHDIVAASATGDEDVDEVVQSLKRQQENIRRAHSAISERLKQEKTEKKAMPKSRPRKKK